jgi:hypothetical protein
MKIADLIEGMKVRDRWWNLYPGFVKKINKKSAVIEFTGDQTISGINKWDEETIEEFIEPW